ncbi:MAG: hypothetical protein IIA45_01000 [Bacteroidetes bacterium]|nr:hypothetical protein [Bacteroidota bacterium]
MISKNRDNNKFNWTDIEKLVHRALKVKGYFFPSTRVEIRSVEKKLEDLTLEIPEKLSDPLKVAQDYNKRLNKSTHSTINENGQELKLEMIALAAREHNTDRIPEEIRSKMIEDRDNSRKSEGNEDN